MSNNLLESACVIHAEEPYLPTSSVCFDIETTGLDAKSDWLLTIGYYEPSNDRFRMLYDPEERMMLNSFWQTYRSVISNEGKMIGFNISGFDIPFLIRRSWKHGIRTPGNIFRYGKLRDDLFIDPMISWACGEWKKFISLDELAKFLGVGGKTGSGERFAEMMETDENQATAYLENDCRLPVMCAQKMGLL